MKPVEAVAARSSLPGVNRLWPALIIGAVLPILSLVILWLARVPLGCPGRFVHLYSPVWERRLGTLPVALLIGAIAALGVALLSDSSIGRRRVGGALVAAGLVAIGFWNFLAAPEALEQHAFNAQSPSQDGAFVHESLGIEDPTAYLTNFPDRARTPPAQMRGTRVISNPPAATMLAYTIRQIFDRSPRLAGFVEGCLDRTGELADEHFATLRRQFAIGIAFYVALGGLWIAAGGVFFAVGRMFFASEVAAVFAVCAIVTPVALLFAPGKDAAQLLTVALPLLFWLHACRAGARAAPRWNLRATAFALAAGFTAFSACLISLIHVWAGLIVFIATLPCIPRGVFVRVLTLRVLALALGAAAAWLFWRMVAGADIVAIGLATAESQTTVTRGPNSMPLAWQWIALPLGALFAGPAIWTTMIAAASSPLKNGDWLAAGVHSAAGNRARGVPVPFFQPAARASELPAAAAQNDRALFSARGLGLALALFFLLTWSYTNIEGPRLWLPITPLVLLLGLLWLRPALATLQSSTRRGWLAALVFLQIAVSAGQWVVMDARETETRLLNKEFFWSGSAPVAE